KTIAINSIISLTFIIQRGNTKTVVDFVENLYGIQKIRSTLSEENSGQLNFHAGLVTYWNARTLEHENEEYYVLCGWIKNIENSDYFYVKKGNNSFRSPYNSAPIKINHEIQLEIDKMRQLAEKDPFRPLELSEHNTMTYGSPKTHGAKKRNPSRFVTNRTNNIINENLKVNSTSGLSTISAPIVNTALLSETYSTSTPIIDPTLLSEAYPTLEMHLEQYEQKEILPLQEKYVHSNTSNPQTIQTTLPHSIQRRNTTRIRNLKRGTQKNVENINSVNLPQKRKHVNDTQETLEAIFLEQGITWKPRAFTDLCISKNIHLADDPVVNDRLIYSWISRRKYKAKQEKEE
ncbi:13525_t:CDS:2, partial [Gigaspora margarita]